MDEIRCEYCGDIVPPETGASTREGTVCDSCYGEYYSTCSECGLAVSNNDGYYDSDEEFICNHCRDDQRPTLRGYDIQTKKYQSLESGKIIKSTRNFGIEIELLAGSIENAVKLCKNLPKEFGIGTDGSIKGNSGLEIRTPVLSGKAGEEATKKICRIMRESGATVNHSCGLHIHLQADNIKGYTAREKSLMLFYIIFDEVVMLMLPTYRRHNRFAKSLKNDFSIGDLLATRDRADLDKYWYKSANTDNVKSYKDNSKHSSRYYGINFHCLLNNRHNTIEIRYHSPTLLATKILNWVALHQAILEKASNLDTETLEKWSKLIFIEDKIDTFFKALKLPEKLEAYYRGRISQFSNTKKLCAA